jgi:hypothetical protein
MLRLRIVKIVIFFLVGDSPVSELYMPTFRNTLFHIHRCKNNLGEIVGVFIREKVWLENIPSQSKGAVGDGEGACPSRATGCGWRRPQVEASSAYVREKRRCVGVRKGSHGMMVVINCCFVREKRRSVGAWKGSHGMVVINCYIS